MRTKTIPETYGRYAVFLASFSLMLAMAWLCVRGAGINRYVAAGAFGGEPVECVEALLDYEKEQETNKAGDTSLTEPLVRVAVLEKETQRTGKLSGQDYEVLCRIVEAEAGTEDAKGKLLVANVVLNRVEDERFPDTVTEVVYQKSRGICQFSPVADGRIDCVTVSPETREAVDAALDGEDISEGALYFVARSAADPENMRWFDTHLVRLFAHGGHEFFG
ncbi:MAG: cell wall hydrolase [Eubacteriales bacterium]|nr:cell wall hydrolase [Eubacteriales bacterium]